MKFDLFKWREFGNGETIECPKGRVQVRASSRDCAFYLQAQGVEVLAGFGQEIDIAVAEPVTLHVSGPKGVRCFIAIPPNANYRTQGEVFTNLDRKPAESGTLLEVQRAVRGFKLEQKAMRLRALNEDREARRRRGVLSDPVPDDGAAVVSPVEPAEPSVSDPVPDAEVKPAKA